MKIFGQEIKNKKETGHREEKFLPFVENPPVQEKGHGFPGAEHKDKIQAQPEEFGKVSGEERKRIQGKSKQGAVVIVITALIENGIDVNFPDQIFRGREKNNEVVVLRCLDQYVYKREKNCGVPQVNVFKGKKACHFLKPTPKKALSKEKFEEGRMRKRKTGKTICGNKEKPAPTYAGIKLLAHNRGD
jgi:hypothetical protein